jgi:hypothetical protein
MEEILKQQSLLVQHPVYATFNDLSGIRHFMRYHVFAVWDFMSLLKSLQNHLTCTKLPWTPSKYPAQVVRLINQIVVGEESDLDQEGKPISHFDLYLRAMNEINAPTFEINDFLATMELKTIPEGAREFVMGNLDVAMNGHVVEVAASFFFGREKLIPEMFTTIVETLDREKIEAPTFRYYLKRHIEIDGDEHGPMALSCFNILTENNPELIRMGLTSGLTALRARHKLWDHVLEMATATKPVAHYPELDFLS